MNSGSPLSPALIASVHEWIAADPDPATRASATALLSEALLTEALAADEAATELLDAFSGRLEFGTAGLRGAMGPGPGRMNRAVVAQTSAGFAEYLLQRANRQECADPPHIVIGHDARDMSAEFARDAAEVFAGRGLRVTMLPPNSPTPLTAFSVRHLNASAGVMITASHNPPQDNGYKVYLGDADGGSQIVAPADREIARLIEQVAQQPLGTITRGADWHTAGPQLAQAYAAAVGANVRAGLRRQQALHPLRVVSTSLHGVGGALTGEVFAAAGLPEYTVVAEQHEPDGAFATVRYPNPEEPGALDLAYRTAHTHNADLIIAHDPDADRLGVAAPHALADASTHGYRRLTGNEVGLLLGWRAAERAQREGRTGTLANTFVSSPALQAVAAHYGLNFTQTLSGAKWLSRVPNLIYAFEEALGYVTQPNIVRDKDGISAAAELVALASEAAVRGQSLWQLLDEASMLFGHYESRAVVVRVDRAHDAARITDALRATDLQHFGDFAVLNCVDMREAPEPHLSANVLRYELSNDVRVMVRPSGTEPKLKVYLHAWSTSGSLDERVNATSAKLDRLEAAAGEMLTRVQRATRNGAV